MLSTAERMLGWFATLLEGIAANPEMPPPADLPPAQ